MIATVLLLAAMQAQAGPPEVQAVVDRDRLSVGEEFTYTVHASSRSAAPMEILLAPLTGFEIVSRSEATQVTAGAAPSRTTTVTVELRALRPGTWLLAPAVAQQGGLSARSERIRVVVASGGASGATALSPRVRSLLQRAPPPSSDEPVAVSVLLSDESVRVGEQVDVVTVAWFPRELRLQMRRPPVLQPPAMEGAWSYPQPVPPGVADSRRVNGIVYDLFVMHQIVFPLVPGALETEGATLRYSVPLALQFFSQEERYTRTSGPARIEVAPLPSERRPPGFEGAVGRNLEITRTADEMRAEVRRAFTVGYVIEGAGNVALWPAPAIEWPSGLRAYPDQVSERVAVTDGRLGGRKTFSYLVIADSAGTFALPGVRYAYFDPAAGYRVASTPAGRIAVAPAGEVTAGRVAPPPLLSAGGPGLARRVIGALPPLVWVVLLCLPPVALVAQRLRPRRTPPPPAAAPATASLSTAEHALDRALASLVPSAATRAGPGLAPALRAAGVAEPLVARTAAVRARLLARRYGPDDAGGDTAALSDEASEVALELSSSRRSRRARRSLSAGTAGLLLIAAALGSDTVLAQSGRPDPLSLYAQGSLRAAAEGFAQRAAAEPGVAAHWYNLGAAWYRLGDDARAAAAWFTAARLEPRDPTIRRALRLVPAPDPASARRTRALPLTPDELALVAGLLWFSGWTVILLRPDALRGGAAFLLASAVVGAGAGLAAREQARPLAIVLQPTELRRSPHHRAPGITPLEPGAAVRPLRREGSWTLAEAPDERLGWLPMGTLSVIER